MTQFFINKIEVLPQIKIFNTGTFEATDEEIDRAAALVGDKVFECDKKFSFLERKFGTKKVGMLYDIIRDEWELGTFPKHRYDIGDMKNYVFDMNVSPEYQNTVIYTKQYELDALQRCVYIYDTLKRKEYGRIIEADDSPNQMATVVIKKEGRNGRPDKYRVARDTSRWNKYIKNIDVDLPTRRDIHWKFRNRGGPVFYIVWDYHSYFDCFRMREEWYKFIPFDSPLGRFVDVFAGYGHKRIMSLCQHASNCMLNQMKKLCHYFERGIIYVDDGAIAVPVDIPWDDVLVIFRTLFQITREEGAKIALDKLDAGDTVEAVGEVFSDGIKLSDKYSQKCIDVPERPKNKKELKQILSLWNWGTDYIWNFAEMTGHLRHLEKKDKPFEWTELEQLYYDQLREYVRNTGILAAPNESGNFVTHSDSSKFGFASACFQENFDDVSGLKTYRLIGFYSKLYPPEWRDKKIGFLEFYGQVHTSTYFKEFLWSKPYIAVTDHKNLVYFLAEETAALKRDQMLRRLLVQFASVPVELRHSKGEFIAFADYGSRIGFSNEIVAAIHEDAKLKQKINRKLLKLQTLRTVEYYRTYGNFDEFRPQFRLELSFSDEFNDNVECINYQKLCSFLLKVRHGGMEALDNGLDDGLDVISSETSMLQLSSGLGSREYNRFWNEYEASITRSYDYKPKIINSSRTVSISAMSTKKHISDKTYSKFVPTPIIHPEKKLDLKKANRKQPASDAALEENLSLARANAEANRLKSLETANSKNLRSYLDPKYYVRSVRTFGMDEMDALRENLAAASVNFDNNNELIKILGTKLRRSPRLQEKEEKKQNNLMNDDFADIWDRNDEISTWRKESILDKIPTDGAINPRTFGAIWDQLHFSDNTKPEDISLDVMRINQKLSRNCVDVCECLKTGSIAPFEQTKRKSCDVWVRGLNKSLFCVHNDVLYYSWKGRDVVVVPEVLRVKVIAFYHLSMHLGHPGATAITKAIRGKFWWPKLDKDVEFACKSCKTCQSGQGNPSKMSLEPWLPTGPGQVVVMDFWGPVVQYFYILGIKDLYTHILVFCVVLEASAAVVCTCLKNKWVPWQGWPKELLMDAGTHFKNELNESMGRIVGFDPMYATDRRHTTIGSIEAEFG